MAVPAAVRALRGATTVDEDTREQVILRVGTLVDQMMSRNGVEVDDIISLLLTATDDVVSCFPAEAARERGLGDVPLICAREIAVEGATPLCVRIMMHINTDRARDALRHVYLEGAQGLRDDLPG